MPTQLSRSLQIARYVALVAATAISLACGTNYVYSAYAPQLAKELHLSTTESNVIGTAGNFGMYLSGIPAGMLVDRKGPRLAILIGAACLFLGYYPIYRVFESGANPGVGWMAMFSALTGAGSCFAFSASIKVAALNFPKSRGTATALPLAAFGLSAFFFSTLSSWLFPGNTSDFLLVLAVATSSIVFVSFFFIRIIPRPGMYSAVPTDEPRISSSRLHRTKSRDSHTSVDIEPGMEASNIHFQVPIADEEGVSGSGSSTPSPNGRRGQLSSQNPSLTLTAATPTTPAASASSSTAVLQANRDRTTTIFNNDGDDEPANHKIHASYSSEPSSSRVAAPPAKSPTNNAANDDETTSFLSASSDSSSYGTKDNVVEGGSVDGAGDGGNGGYNDYDRGRRASINDERRGSLSLDIRGWALTKHSEFWRQFFMLGILTGVGLMTINNIGHSVQALWYYKDPSKASKDVERFQGIHVSILSICSFSGRLMSGTTSDVLKKKWGYSRVWLVFSSSVVFFFGQLAGMSVSNPMNLWLVSGLNGFGYGLVFGVFPTIVSEAFGLHGLSQNWGTMTLAPVIFGNITNLFYGRIYDSHSRQLDAGHYECSEGIGCYRAAYVLTSVASICVMLISLWGVWIHRLESLGKRKVMTATGSFVH